MAVDKYRILKEAITDLNGPHEVDWVVAKSLVACRLDEITDANVRAQYISDLKNAFEEALIDPEFDWVKTGDDTRFTHTLAGDTSWPYNYRNGVIQEFKAVFFTFLYPESEMSKEGLHHLSRVVIFLLLEVEGTVEWMHYKILLEQLRTMKPAWQHLDYFHFNILIDYRHVLDFKWEFADSEKHAVRLAKGPSAFQSISYIKARPVDYENPYEGWPPFQNDPVHPYFLQYRRQDWLEIIRSHEFLDPALPDASTI